MSQKHWKMPLSWKLLFPMVKKKKLTVKIPTVLTKAKQCYLSLNYTQKEGAGNTPDNCHFSPLCKPVYPKRNVPDKDTQLEGRYVSVSAIPTFLQSSMINCTKQNDWDKINYHTEPSSLCSLSDAPVTLARTHQAGCWDTKLVPEAWRLRPNFFP